jgi:phage shock protein PspC (stress-responsive transcriptional regulator)
VIAGVSGGLGEYFGVDPVLFRVLFATSAFFGGVGIIGYLVAWAVIPERGNPAAPLDGVAGWLRRHRIPVGVAVAVAAVLAWASLFSWWRPWPFFPLLIVAIVLVAVLERNRDRRAASFGGGGASTGMPPAGMPPAAVPPAGTAPTAGYPASDYPYPTNPMTSTAQYPPAPATANQSEFRAWVAEARTARARRRQANRPLRVAVWSAIVLALLGLGIADGITGIPMPTYLWVIGSIVVVGLVVGAVLRRPVWGFAPILFPVVVLLVALGGTSASLHDGSGDRSYAPSSAADIQSTYHQAFGRLRLDLTQVGVLDGRRTVDVRQAAGQVKLIVPRTLDVTVRSRVWAGEVEVDRQEVQSGADFRRDVVLGPGDSDRLTVDVDLTDGQVSIERVG